MNQHERNLIKYCKIGDLDKIKNLLDNEDVSLNLRDKWDSTPLYYACLCGHLSVVKFLLESGARCEANTFDSERCQYGALTDEIRNVLREFKVNKAKLDHYELFLERLYEIGHHSDIIFDIKGRIFKAHKCILSARSEYFRLKFENKWKNRTYIFGSHEQIIPEAFDSIFKYIYTERFVTHTSQFKSCLRLAKLLKLNYLIDELNRKFHTLHLNNESYSVDKSEHTFTTKMNELTVKDAEIFLMGKFGHKMSNTISIEPIESTKLNQINKDLKLLANSCFPGAPTPLKNIVDFTYDLCFNLVDENLKIKAHKAFFVERCDYFRTFLQHDPFNEIKEIDDSKSEYLLKEKVLNLKDVDWQTFKEIVYFLYSDCFSDENLDENLLLDVLIAADLYLLPSLKRKCANELCDKLNKENLFELLRLSRLYDLKKLEFSCISYLAMHIFDFETSQELRKLILEDASKLKQRQETDTIDIVDDLRYAINDTITLNPNNTNNNHLPLNDNQKFVSSFDLLVQKERKLNLIDNILKELNLEC